MGLLLFIAAGTLNFWQGWFFLLVFGGSALAITLYLIKYDNKLLERRVKGGPTAEKEPAQKIIQYITTTWYISMLVVPGLDHRFRWSVISFPLVLVGDLLIALGFLIVFLVFKENTFTSATIEIAHKQKVISTGFYALVRHPMYLGAVILSVGMILALGSWWNILPCLLMLPALIWRLLEEEIFLVKYLPGYRDYQKKIKYHLAPFIW